MVTCGTITVRVSPRRPLADGALQCHLVVTCGTITVRCVPQAATRGRRLTMPPGGDLRYYNCPLCPPGGHSRTARVLLGMVIPGHLVFCYSISYLRAGHTSLTPMFLIVYNSAALLQVSRTRSHELWAVWSGNRPPVKLSACGNISAATTIQFVS